MKEAQMSIMDGAFLMDKLWYAHIMEYNGILLGHEKGMRSCHLQQHGRPRGYFAK